MDNFRKYYAIRKIQQNLLDLKLQYIFVALIGFGVYADQIVNIYIQWKYDILGLEGSFFTWWLKIFIENMGNL